MPARGKGKGKSGKSKRISSTKRAGLAMPVSRIKKYLKDGRFAPRTSAAAPVYLAAVLEYCGML